MKNENPTEMGFLEHLEELRWRIVRSLLAIIIGSAVSFGYIDEILNILLFPTSRTNNPINIQVLSVQGMFLIKWFISFISGFIIALPFLIYQFWQFVAPGLKVNEKKFALPFVFFCVYFFHIGCLIWLFCIDTFQS